MSTVERPPYGAPETRRRILDAAWALVSEHGDLTLGGVAKAAGVSRQAVYLHFEDRTGLLLALVVHMDDSLGLGEMTAHIAAAPTGAEALARAVEVHSRFNAGIDSVARFLEPAFGPDNPLAIAWRERMGARLGFHRGIVERIAEDGMLADGWTVDAAAELFHAVTLPSAWRELTHDLGWSAEDYVDHLTRMLGGAFVRR